MCFPSFFYFLQLPSTITLPLNQSHLFDLTELKLWKSEAFVTETSSSPQRRSTFPLAPALLRHPVLRHFLELWLADPFADVVMDVGPKPTVEGVHSAPATTTTYSCPQFALATTLCLDNFRGLALGTSKSSNTEQFVVHWLDNKAYRFDSQLKNLLLGCMKRIFNTPSAKADEAAQDPNQTLNLVDSLALLDKSVMTLISEWQHDPDVVISVHPTDGSLIAWYIHGLDTCVPNPSGICTQPLPLLNGSNRPNFLPSTFIVSPSLGTKLTQVTTSLRSKLNGAFTVAEAASLLPKVFLFPLAVPQNCHNFQMLRCNASQNGSLSSDIGVLFCRLLVLYNALEALASHSGTVHTGLPGGITDNEQHSCKLAIMRDITEIQLLCSTFGTEIHRSQYVAMVTRHVNGSLRYWRLDLSESNRFQWILSINGSARLSGHRFHTEAILPHPLVPLLLTTSHFSHTSLYFGSAIEDAQNSHSELILWRAGPIGPLTSTSILPGRDISQCQHSAGAEKAHLDGFPFYRDSAGVTFSDSGLVEVARITVSHSDPSHTWFSDLAWFPCTLTTSLTVYPMVLFLGNLYEGQSSTDQLGFFLAFLDAKDTRFVSANRASTPPSDSSAPRFFGFTNSDTSGCVIQLPNTLPDSSRRLYEPQSSTISETLLLHVFPIQLVHTSKYKPLEATFERGLENDSLSTFMVVRLTQRKTDSSSADQITYRRMPTLEMWRVNVRTQPSFAVCPNADRLRVDNLHIFNDMISGIQKVCDCDLPLPKEVYVVMAAVSAADVSWVSLFDHRAPPPYLIMSACSDGCLRFWRCDVGEAKISYTTSDLAVYAPGLVKITWLLDTWTTGYSLILTSPPAFTRQTLLKGPFDAFDSHLIPPPHFIPDLGSVLTDAFSGKRASEAAALMPSTGATRALLRLRHLIDPSKTPFQTRDPFSLPAKRLWCHLVRQPYVDDMITRHVFRRPRLVQCLVVPSLSMPIPSQATQPTNAPSSKLSIGSLDERPKNGAAVPGKITRSAQAHPAALSTAPNSVLLDDAIRLIHKEQEPLMAMCVNQVTYGCVAVATPKELIELNTENLVTLPAWFADEVEYDLELMRKPQPRVYPEGGTDDFITLNFVNLVGEHAFSAQSAGAGGTPNSDAPSAHVILKRTLPAVYSLAAHPMLPYYLAGTGMGSIHLYEWGTVMPVVAGFSNTYSLTPSGATGQYPAGSRGARVTALRFDDSGRRFGCGDADGYFGLWNTQTTAPQKPPYFRCKCHAKGLADFCFVGCSTLIATAGNGCAGGSLLTGTVASSGQIGGGDTVSGTGGSFFYGADQDGANLTLWDTLMSPTRCGVIRVTDPELEAPCTSVAYLAPSINCSGWPDRFLSSRFSSNGPFPSYSAGISLGSVRDRVVVVGTKRGDVCYVDLRKPKVLLSFSAHESAVRALCVDTTSDCLITGGADGNIKIWRLSDHELMISFPADFHQGRGAAAVAAAALFRGNQSAAIIAATNPGVSEIRLLPLATEASLLTQSNLGAQSGDESIYQQHRDSVVAASTACRFLSCGADGGLRMRSYVMRPRPFNIC
ncbi:unnamed protein product [Dicrocoelium dendriticum]|nr:unnamed protein product [Dicrocoelium dendriticum]